MSARLSKTTAKRIEDVISWTSVLISLTAVVVLDSPSQPHKWHPAIMWTMCAFLSIVLLGRSRWSSIGFWLLCTAALVAHLFVMWALFGKIIPSNFVVGTIYVAPIGFFEGIFILVLIGKLMGWSSDPRKKGAGRIASDASLRP